MRADPRQSPGTQRIEPVTAEDSPNKSAMRSVPIAETPADVSSHPTVTEAVSLLPDDVASQFRSRWDLIQNGFVDDPRRAVDQAGALVEEALHQLNAVFDEKRAHLQRDGGIPTEDLRQTLRHYRLLLNRLF